MAYSQTQKAEYYTLVIRRHIKSPFVMGSAYRGAKAVQVGTIPPNVRHTQNCNRETHTKLIWVRHTETTVERNSYGR